MMTEIVKIKLYSKCPLELAFLYIIDFKFGWAWKNWSWRWYVLFRYSINQAQPDDSFPFNLDEATGQIWTSRTLDRDSRRSNPKWNFAVVASNPYKGNGPSQPVMAQVTIELLDKNDNKPTIKAIRPATSSTHKVRKGTEKVHTNTRHTFGTRHGTHNWSLKY